MAGLEAIASLAPKSSSMMRERDNVPWEIVCMALAKIPKEASMYGRLKYALEYSYHRKVRDILLKHILSIKWKRTTKWKPNIDFFRSVADLALKESLEPMCCPKCSGRGQVFVEETLYKCTLCLGVGIKSMSDKVRANYLDVPRESFRRNIKYHYFNDVMPLIREWEDALVRAMRRM
mgnify:FL=1|jgi:hypothetical protein|tara:strand:+ start:144 stop:674 length:531 start_codon:yes stop_codon:yes gene_type:complete